MLLSLPKKFLSKLWNCSKNLSILCRL